VALGVDTKVLEAVREVIALRSDIDVFETKVDPEMLGIDEEMVVLSTGCNVEEAAEETMVLSAGIGAFETGMEVEVSAVNDTMLKTEVDLVELGRDAKVLDPTADSEVEGTEAEVIALDADSGLITEAGAMGEPATGEILWPVAARVLG
jgi:hypothetical protein